MDEGMKGWISVASFWQTAEQNTVLRSTFCFQLSMHGPYFGVPRDPAATEEMKQM